jgi:serine/threonine protein kinase
MSLESVDDLVQILNSSPLLTPARCAELAGLSARFPEPRALAGELLRRGWLTAYQINQIFAGRVTALVLGQYVLLERLAEGGLALVFKARHLRLGRVVALKLPRPEVLGDPGQRDRFERQALALALLHHPNIVALYDVKEIGGNPFLALELVEGPTLLQLMQRAGPLPPGRACEFARQAALGLHHAHERNVVHRDVNPSNLVLAEKEGVVKLIGFGLARLDQPAASTATSRPTKRLTEEGVTLGTPDYIAPEQWFSARDVDHRADLYSLGCTLYHLLTGRPPFEGGTVVDKAVQHREARPVPVEEACPDVQPKLAAVVHQLLAKQPDERPATAAELAEALQPFCPSIVGDDDFSLGVVGQYQLLQRLHESNMSQVCKARDLRCGRLVVLKVLTDALLANPDAVARFRREGKAMARLAHPNLPLLYDADEVDGKPFLVLEYVEGSTLAALVKEVGPLPVAKACDYARQAALVLQHLHERGVIHRDVSPGNLVAAEGGAVIKLLDLGVCRLQEPEDDADRFRTTTNCFMGTPDFMAPEQVTSARNADRRADIYGLGCTLYYLLSGQPPFPGGSASHKAARHLDEQPASVEEQRSDVPNELAAVVRKMMAKNPAERYQTAAQAASALGEFAGEQSRAQPHYMPTTSCTQLPRASMVGSPSQDQDMARTGCRPRSEAFDTVPPQGCLEAVKAPAPPQGPPIHLPPRPAAGRTGWGLWKLLQRGAKRRWPFRSRGPARDVVNCTVFAPPTVPAGEMVFVQVFIHLPEAAEAAWRLAREFDAEAKRRAFKSLPAEIARGTTLTFHLAMPLATIAEPTQSLVWRGRPEPVQFAVDLPDDLPVPSTLVGTVTVCQENVPFGHIKFKLSVSQSGKAEPPAALGDAAHCYRKAFISYASIDRIEVLKRVQMLRPLRIRFFQDVLDLAPGDRWERQLYRHIDESDLFLLFWSKAARESRWVRKELLYALSRKGGDDDAPPAILPVILEGPPPPKPPEELADLHFDDYMLYFMPRATPAELPRADG